LWITLTAAQLAVALVPEGWSGLVRPWTAPNLVYAWSARRVKEPRFFLETFEHVYRRLDLHSKSHPPGATLLAYWSQNHSRPASRENVLRLLLLGSVNVPLAFALAWSMFGESRRATVAAALVGASPTAVSLGTFSQDGVYAVFFTAYLAVVWLLARTRRIAATAVAAGALLFALTMLTFSWTIAAAGGALFLLIEGRRRREPVRAVATRLPRSPPQRVKRRSGSSPVSITSPRSSDRGSSTSASIRSGPQATGCWRSPGARPKSRSGSARSRRALSSRRSPEARSGARAIHERFSSRRSWPLTPCRSSSGRTR
ncbi:MAG: hypothetical protein ACREQ9_03465, partial [Candidatus Binatia bacterium]